LKTITHTLEKHQPIGVFDSGIGGLTVANAIQKHLPNEEIIYFGDTAHLPYGDKAPYSIKHYSTEIAKFLLKKKCKLIVIACNTASSIAVKDVEKVTKGKAILINVIDPVVEKVHQQSKPGDHVGIIGTKGTIKSGVYRKKLRAFNELLNVSSMATPLLAPMIEEGFINDKISQTVLESYLTDKKLEAIDAIILACTHYPLIKDEINAFYKGRVNVVDSADIVGRFVKKQLEQLNLLSDTSNPNHQFFVSDYTSSFERSTRYFFTEKITLEKAAIW
jgi:glutamate racemase